MRSPTRVSVSVRLWFFISFDPAWITSDCENFCAASSYISVMTNSIVCPSSGSAITRRPALSHLTHRAFALSFAQPFSVEYQLTIPCWFMKRPRFPALFSRPDFHSWKPFSQSSLPSLGTPRPFAGPTHSIQCLLKARHGFRSLFVRTAE